MSYLEQLKTSEWLSKREKILTRDKHLCQNCKNKKFDNSLNSGILFLPQYDPEENFICRHILNINFEYQGLRDTLIRINKQILLTKFTKIPKFLWIDYLLEDGGLRTRTCFIRTLNQEIKNEFKELRRRNEEQKDIDRNKDAFPNIITYDIGTWDEKIDDEPSHTKNPYFSQRLLEIGRNLPICSSHCLEVHHTAYRQNRMAWQYPDKELVTLCWSCHEELHKNMKVPYYSEDDAYLGDLTPCSQCGGAGRFPE